MGRMQVMALAALALLAGGCAGARTRQDLSRLNSQIGLLEERVAQLERSGGPGAISTGVAEPGVELGAPAGDATAVPAPRRQASSSARHKSGAASASAKPSTREIQQALKNAGFYQGAVDGKMGSMTREAVKEFQRIHGLTEDGVVGRQTWGKLKAYAEMSASDGEAGAAEPLK